MNCVIHFKESYSSSPAFHFKPYNPVAFLHFSLLKSVCTLIKDWIKVEIMQRVQGNTHRGYIERRWSYDLIWH